MRVVVAGGGISGLAAAFRLQRPGVEVVLLEPRDRPGGTLWTLRRDGFQVETGANGFLDIKNSTLDLCRDLGIGDKLLTASEAAAANRFLFVEGRMKMLPRGFGAFLASDLLTWRGKLSFLLERWRRKRTDDADESIAAFARRRAGAEVADVIADAMVTGIYAGDPNLLSLPACFPRIATLEKEHGSVLKGMGKVARQRRLEAKKNNVPYKRPGAMYSFRDGLRVLVEALRDRLTTPPVLGVAVRQVRRLSEGWEVQGEGQDRWQADAVVLTCPAPQQAQMLADVDAELSQRIAAIAYNKVAVVALGFRRADVPGSVDGFGFIAPQKDRRDLLGVQWCSSIFPGRAPDDAILLRALCGGWQRADMVTWDDQRLLQSVRDELRLAMGISAAPIFHEIVRWPQAIPQYHLGHLQRVAWIEERCRRHPGLFLGGNAYRGVSLNDCTEQGEVLAGQVHAYLSNQARTSSL